MGQTCEELKTSSQHLSLKRPYLSECRFSKDEFASLPQCYERADDDPGIRCFAIASWELYDSKRLSPDKLRHGTDDAYGQPSRHAHEPTHG